MLNLTIDGIAALAQEQPALGFTLFAIGNTIATSVIPIPVGVFFCLIAGIVYGVALGTTLYVVTCVVGSWITFVLTRCLRPVVISRLGSYTTTWDRIDVALSREGPIICVLWRVAPAAPFVISSVLLSLTTISHVQYMWTTAVGIIPSSLLLVSTAAFGRNLVSGRASVAQVVFNIASIIAGVYVMYRLTIIAQSVLQRNAAEEEKPALTSDPNKAGKNRVVRGATPNQASPPLPSASRPQTRACSATRKPGALL